MCKDATFPYTQPNVVVCLYEVSRAMVILVIPTCCFSIPLLNESRTKRRGCADIRAFKPTVSNPRTTGPNCRSFVPHGSHTPLARPSCICAMDLDHDLPISCARDATHSRRTRFSLERLLNEKR